MQKIFTVSAKGRWIVGIRTNTEKLLQIHPYCRGPVLARNAHSRTRRLAAVSFGATLPARSDERNPIAPQWAVVFRRGHCERGSDTTTNVASHPAVTPHQTLSLYPFTKCFIGGGWAWVERGVFRRIFAAKGYKTGVILWGTPEWDTTFSRLMWLLWHIQWISAKKQQKYFWIKPRCSFFTD